MAIEHGADFRAPEGQTEVTGGAFMNGIDSKATSLSRGLGENLSRKFHNKKRCRRELELRRDSPTLQSSIIGINIDQREQPILKTATATAAEARASGSHEPKKKAGSMIPPGAENKLMTLA
jgi:hypothetical protein